MFKYHFKNLQYTLHEQAKLLNCISVVRKKAARTARVAFACLARNCKCVWVYGMAQVLDVITEEGSLLKLETNATLLQERKDVVLMT